MAYSRRFTVYLVSFSSYRTFYIMSRDVTRLTCQCNINKKVRYLDDNSIKFNETWHICSVHPSEHFRLFIRLSWQLTSTQSLLFHLLYDLAISNKILKKNICAIFAYYYSIYGSCKTVKLLT